MLAPEKREKIKIIGETFGKIKLFGETFIKITLFWEISEKIKLFVETFEKITLLGPGKPYKRWVCFNLTCRKT